MGRCDGMLVCRVFEVVLQRVPVELPVQALQRTIGAFSV